MQRYGSRRGYDGTYLNPRFLIDAEARGGLAHLRGSCILMRKTMRRFQASWQIVNESRAGLGKYR